MKNTNKLESGFIIKNLILMDSSFSRTDSMVFGEDVNNNFRIDIEVAVKEKVITVVNKATVVQKYKDIEQVKVEVRMVGIFECIGDTLLTDFEEFGRINGSAIIFPYIREHITNISLKAGIGAIILPPVNFTETDKTPSDKPNT